MPRENLCFCGRPLVFQWISLDNGNTNGFESSRVFNITRQKRATEAEISAPQFSHREKWQFKEDVSTCHATPRTHQCLPLGSSHQLLRLSISHLKNAIHVKHTKATHTSRATYGGAQHTFERAKQSNRAFERTKTKIEKETQTTEFIKPMLNHTNTHAHASFLLTATIVHKPPSHDSISIDKNTRALQTVQSASHALYFCTGTPRHAIFCIGLMTHDVGKADATQ